MKSKKKNCLAGEKAPNCENLEGNWTGRIFGSRGAGEREYAEKKLA